LVIANNLNAIHEMGAISQYKVKYEIIEKYKPYNQAHPYEWLEKCLDPNNIHIISNTTEFDDGNAYAYYYESNNNGTEPGYFVQFTTSNCPGISPSDGWVASPRQMVIDDYTAIGEHSWFSQFENTYAYAAGVPIAANNYKVAELPVITASTVGQNWAKVGAGFYASGVFGLSALGMADVIQQMTNSGSASKNTLMWFENAFIYSLAFMQGNVKSAPLDIEVYLTTENMNNQPWMWTIISLTALASALTYVPDFTKVFKKTCGAILDIFCGANIHDDEAENLDKVKEMILSMKPEVVKALKKKYAE
jgi:hypothetical protein